ncbi:Protein of unknown function (DUF1822) [Rivularia sp. PCC 7116]|uniref:DUF1822 family protein n=1 Tax=Rivularia sp. PCC 7116 TaxID=373994 RepID=UPI00029F30F4|nr:DUF1822 family protein [Rivularia sp. PCC 7116]AFY56920.1 Protein of unknown function (DUF1822) [Rivularia sp. PCC 7116]
MTFDLETLSLNSPTNLWLEIPENQQTKIWEQSQAFSTDNRRWMAYLNRLSLKTFLPWFKEEYAQNAKVFPNSATLPSVWEVTNGTGICFNGKKLVLIPSEALDISELRVPQEWVDIPSWSADYYAAVQVNVEAGYIRIWGYTSAVNLKEKGTYDANERNYCLNKEDLISNFSILRIAAQVCPEEITKTETVPLAELSATQAENLIARLGNSQLINPRQAVPFTMWGALLEHGGWRQGLYEKRQGMQRQWSIRQWMQTGVSEFAQQFGWGSVDLQPSLASSRGTEAPTQETTLIKKITISGLEYHLSVKLRSNNQNRIWRFELRRATVGEMIPVGVKLMLLTEDLQPFDGNQAQAKKPVERIYVDVALGGEEEALVWKTEPVSDDYEYETLYL